MTKSAMLAFYCKIWMISQVLEVRNFLGYVGEITEVRNFLGYVGEITDF
jgi:hypothetical protein